MKHTPLNANLWAAIGLLVLSTSVTLVGAPPAQAASSTHHNQGTCTSKSGQYRHDPNTGWSWTTLWWCSNHANAPLYMDADYRIKTATMDTTRSWFVCYRRGAKHKGGNDVWYYSLGDRSEPPYERREAWGFMAAADVSAKTHPWPGVPECPASGSVPPQ
ncbi:MAG: hypothetical protein HY308_17025 [Gammaproteobacteria bacterium]|nr:hypothetical protein [Gammaproteobacteria bacterium]